MKVSITKHLNFEFFKMGSPLRPLGFLFKVTNGLGGFPFKVLNNDCTVFKPDNQAITRLLLFLVSVSTFSVGILAYSLYVLGGFLKYVDHNRKHGLSYMDTVAIGLIIFPHVIGTFAFIRSFFESEFQVNASIFCDKVANLRGLPKIRQGTVDNIHFDFDLSNQICLVKYCEIL